MTVVVAPDQPCSTRQSIVAVSRRCWVTRLRSCCGARLGAVMPVSVPGRKESVKPDCFAARTGRPLAVFGMLIAGVTPGGRCDGEILESGRSQGYHRTPRSRATPGRPSALAVAGLQDRGKWDVRRALAGPAAPGRG